MGSDNSQNENHKTKIIIYQIISLKTKQMLQKFHHVTIKYMSI